MERSPRSLVTLTVALVVAALGTWWWQAGVVGTRRHEELGHEPWDHIKHEYPILPGSTLAPSSPKELLESVAQANPFSPKRRLVSQASESSKEGGGGGGSAPVEARFTYKGRIDLGDRQRAIVQESVTGKTYFLEVGQEVAGFKVLDITENRVVLSDLKTHKEVVVSMPSRNLQ